MPKVKSRPIRQSTEDRAVGPSHRGGCSSSGKPSTPASSLVTGVQPGYTSPSNTAPAQALRRPLIGMDFVVEIEDRGVSPSSRRGTPIVASRSSPKDREASSAPRVTLPLSSQGRGASAARVKSKTAAALTAPSQVCSSSRLVHRVSGFTILPQKQSSNEGRVLKRSSPSEVDELEDDVSEAPASSEDIISSHAEKRARTKKGIKAIATDRSSHQLHSYVRHRVMPPREDFPVTTVENAVQNEVIKSLSMSRLKRNVEATAARSTGTDGVAADDLQSRGNCVCQIPQLAQKIESYPRAITCRLSQFERFKLMTKAPVGGELSQLLKAEQRAELLGRESHERHKAMQSRIDAGLGNFSFAYDIRPVHGSLFEEGIEFAQLTRSSAKMYYHALQPQVRQKVDREDSILFLVRPIDEEGQDREISFSDEDESEDQDDLSSDEEEDAEEETPSSEENEGQSQVDTLNQGSMTMTQEEMAWAFEQIGITLIDDHGPILNSKIGEYVILLDRVDVRNIPRADYPVLRIDPQKAIEKFGKSFPLLLVERIDGKTEPPTRLTRIGSRVHLDDPRLYHHAKATYAVRRNVYHHNRSDRLVKQILDRQLNVKALQGDVLSPNKPLPFQKPGHMEARDSELNNILALDFDITVRRVNVILDWEKIHKRGSRSSNLQLWSHPPSIRIADDASGVQGMEPKNRSFMIYRCGVCCADSRICQDHNDRCYLRSEKSFRARTMKEDSTPL